MELLFIPSVDNNLLIKGYVRATPKSSKKIPTIKDNTKYLKSFFYLL